MQYCIKALPTTVIFFLHFTGSESSIFCAIVKFAAKIRRTEKGYTGGSETDPVKTGKYFNGKFDLS